MASMIVVFCAVVAAAHASVLPAAVLSTGTSISSRQEDGLGNYAFSYGIADGVGATNSRSEVGDALGNKKGAYTLTDIDGRARRVDYVADKLGFRASVATNEPGTAASAPAAALINSPYAAPVAPAPIAAPAVIATKAAFAAPIAGPLALGPIGLGLNGLALNPYALNGLTLNGLGLGAGVIKTGIW